MRPDGPRDPYAGPEAGPEHPYPVQLQGPVIKGFGRGSKELGIPTANIPPEGLSAYPNLSTGVYYGFVGLKIAPSSTTQTSTASAPTYTAATYPAVLSIGYNPFYANKTRSVEIHVLQRFADDFYGAALNLLILGFIRPEYDYVSKESLIEDIMVDCEVARRSLTRPGYAKWQNEEKWLTDFAWADSLGKDEVREVEGRVLGGAVGQDAQSLEEQRS